MATIANIAQRILDENGYALTIGDEKLTFKKVKKWLTEQKQY